MKPFAKIAMGLAAVFVAIQAVPVDRSNPPVEMEIPVPPPVREVLQRSCYDCHSNHTRWPWYTYVAPVSWMIADHVHEGRHELNFSTWNVYPPDKAGKKIREVGEEVREEKMPLPSYLLLHGDARLSEADRQVLVNWAAEMGASEEH